MPLCTLISERIYIFLSSSALFYSFTPPHSLSPPLPPNPSSFSSSSSLKIQPEVTAAAETTFVPVRLITGPSPPPQQGTIPGTFTRNNPSPRDTPDQQCITRNQSRPSSHRRRRCSCHQRRTGRGGGCKSKLQ